MSFHKFIKNIQMALPMLKTLMYFLLRIKLEDEMYADEHCYIDHQFLARNVFSFMGTESKWITRSSKPMI